MGRQEQDYSVRYWKISVKREGVGKNILVTVLLYSPSILDITKQFTVSYGTNPRQKFKLSYISINQYV